MLAPAMSSDAARLTWELIEQARARITGKVTTTPVLTSHALDALCGAQLFFKCENFQKCGAFKARGATNAVFALSAEQAQHGVATHSSGNHAAALSRAARLRGIRAQVVMPENSAHAKRDAVQRYGGEITWCAPTHAAREAAARRIVESTGATLVHPYDDLAVMAGQATATVELLEQVADLDLILCPVGGGGLLSGTAVAAGTLRPTTGVIGVEPAGADDAARSLRSGHIVACEHPDTIADGLRGSLSTRTFAEISQRVEAIVTVPDASIVRAMRTLFEVLKIVVEPSGAVSYAAVLEERLDLKGLRVGLIVSGGNVDLERLPWMRGADSIP
jgi:threonine dehydratase